LVDNPIEYIAIQETRCLKMRKVTFFALSILAVAVVLLLSGWRTGANSRKRGRGDRQVTRRSGYWGEGGGEQGGVSKTREAYPEREVMVREGLYSDIQPKERTLPSAERVAGYLFLVAGVFAAATVLGGVIAVGMEYLVGWPDTWWL
jgi:hypothetical protein